VSKNFLKRELLLLAVVAAPIIYLVTVWDRLPEQLPVHWNIRGEADNYGPKYLLALVTAGIYVLFLVLPKIDPRKKNYDIFSATYFKLRLVIILFSGVLNSAVITNALGFEMNLSRIIAILVLLLLTMVGNYLDTVRPNWFIGIRVPWTLESDVVWTKTHQLAGRLWFWGGLAALVWAFFLPEKILYPMIAAVALTLTIVPIVYSYILFRKEKKAAEV